VSVSRRTVPPISARTARVLASSGRSRVLLYCFPLKRKTNRNFPGDGKGRACGTLRVLKEATTRLREGWRGLVRPILAPLKA
jgi:hypothetical protein